MIKIKRQLKNLISIFLLTIIILFCFIIYENNRLYIQAAPMKSGKHLADKSFRIDLDGDGNTEKVLYTNRGILYINDKKYTSPKEKLGMDPPLDDYFTLIDIDSTDKYIEIGISTYGRSDDLMTLFYYYDKGNLIYMGELGGIPFLKEGGRGIFLTKNGLLKASIRLSILQTWFSYSYFKLNNNHQLIWQKQKLYKTPYNNKAKLLRPLKLYSKPNKRAKSYVVPVQPVAFTMTDNKHWCKLKSKDGTEGWFYTDACYMEDLTTLTTDVFDGLALYD